MRDEDILLVRQSVEMRQVASLYGLKIHRGDMVCCPFHGADKHPSMKIYKGSKGYYCFTCHAGGDAIDFVRRHDGLSFDQAVRHLAQMFNIPLSDRNGVSEEVKKALAKQKAEREAAEKARIATQERLKEVSGQIHRLKALQAEFSPLSGVWCAVQKKLEMLEAEWECKFEDYEGVK